MPTLETLLLLQGSKEVRTALDVASLKAVPLDLVGTVAQVLLGVLKESSANELLPLDVVVSMSRDQRRRKGVDEEGRETHGDLSENVLEVMAKDLGRDRCRLLVG